MRLTLLLALSACTAIKHVGGGDGWDCFGLCGEVYQCQADGESDLELCWANGGDEAGLEDSLDVQLGGAWSCGPTPRHLGPCWYSCDPGHRGCNALSGCWCPP